MASKQEQLIKEIGGLTVLELAQLVKALETEFGVSAAAPMMAGPAVAAGGEAGAAKAEEKSEYKVELSDGGAVISNQCPVVIRNRRREKQELTQRALREEHRGHREERMMWGLASRRVHVVSSLTPPTICSV